MFKDLLKIFKGINIKPTTQVAVEASKGDVVFDLADDKLKYSEVDGALESVASETYVQDELLNYIPLTQKGAANGVAELDALGKVPANQLPNAIMEYQGVWDASTNTPTLADGAGNPDISIGDVYRVNVAGTVDFGAGPITFNVSDYAILNSSKIWEKADTTDAVTTVNGQIGDVVLDADDVLAANQALSNLTNPTSINQSLLPQTSESINLGSNSLFYSNLYSRYGFYAINGLQTGFIGPIDGTRGDASSYLNSFAFTTFGGNADALDLISEPAIPIFIGTDRTSSTNPSGNVKVYTGNTDASGLNSGAITIATGDVLTASNSGDVAITTGSVSGGIRGEVSIASRQINVNSQPVVNVTDPTNLQDAATKNYVDTEIAAIPESANRTLSNLLSPTSINQDLLSNLTNTINIGSDTNKFLNAFVNNLQTDDINVGQFSTFFAGLTSGIILKDSSLLDSLAVSTEDGTSKSIQITTGQKTTAGNTGQIFISSSNSDVDGNSGKVILTTGDKNTGLGSSGALEFRTGFSFGGQDTGSIELTTGDPFSGGTRGAIILRGRVVQVDSKIVNVIDPTNPQDAATKAYVDTEISAIPESANRTLSNLTSPTSINQNLLPNLADTIDIGTFNDRYKDVWANRLLIGSGGDTLQVLQDRITSPFSGVTIETTQPDSNITLIPDGIGVVNVSSKNIINVLDPVNPQDAATKAYVDANAGSPDALLKDGTVPLNNDVYLKGRNAANNGDIEIIKVDSNDRVTILNSIYPDNITNNTLELGESGNGFATIYTSQVSSGFTYIDVSGASLYNAATEQALDWENRYLLNGPVISVEWGAGVLRDGSDVEALNWNISRTLIDTSAQISVDWDTRSLNSSVNESLNWESRTLVDSAGSSVLDWGTELVANTNLTPSAPSYNLGSASTSWDNVYASTIRRSNEVVSLAGDDLIVDRHFNELILTTASSSIGLISVNSAAEVTIKVREATTNSVAIKKVYIAAKTDAANSSITVLTTETDVLDVVITLVDSGGDIAITVTNNTANSVRASGKIEEYTII